MIWFKPIFQMDKRTETGSGTHSRPQTQCNWGLDERRLHSFASSSGCQCLRYVIWVLVWGFLYLSVSPWRTETEPYTFTANPRETSFGAMDTVHVQ